ncbi:hypothetical protein PENSPDRAFT_590775 [Peniophora sp. CONT]|nr:hypothetical protein PENSPDRAFT_590775 [Peniophora sp. CONT]
MTYDYEYDDHSDCDSESSSVFEEDLEQLDNARRTPDWQGLRSLLKLRGCYLDTAADVRRFYEKYWRDNPGSENKSCREYQRACSLLPSALCRDPGLPDNLARARHAPHGTRIMIKAVGLRSREAHIVRRLSSPAMRNDPRNHCIPILDIISVPDQDLTLLVMEEWSSELMPDTPCCLRLFLRALRSCVLHMVFLHEHRIAHLDISLRNLVTDYQGHYACIDYEASRCFEGVDDPRIHIDRGTELPPEMERGEGGDPFAADVWAMGILFLRALHMTGRNVPELVPIIRDMLADEPCERPRAPAVLRAFDAMLPSIHPGRLDGCPYPTEHAHSVTNT